MWLAVLLFAAATIVVGADRTAVSSGGHECSSAVTQSTPRPALGRVLEGAVAGPSAIAPGATAYVLGPHGRWLGAAGIADTRTCRPMAPDSRTRLESVTKIYTATLILRLDQERKLRVTDTVERWLPGLLPYGRRITIRELLTMTSGLIDNNDFLNASDTVKNTYLRRVKDPKLRATLLATAKRINENPAVVVPERLWIEWAAWQPLRFTPGLGYHYSNIGYDILGLIAARAGGKSLPELYRETIFGPLGLRATAYDPQGPIRGPHARGYGIEAGRQIDTTDWHWGVGAEGGIVSNAEETGTFLTALMRGKLIDRQELESMKGENLWSGGMASGCADQAYGWSGGGSGYKSEVWVNGDGSRVAVLRLNARHLGAEQAAADSTAHEDLVSLYCAA